MSDKKWPSFKEQLAVVYDDYMDTLGGGERSALAYAKALMTLGFQTEIISTRAIPSQDKIVDIFGDEFSDVKINKVETKNLYQYLKSIEMTVFVNHTYLSFLPNPGKVGIYSQMFPNMRVKKSSHPKEVGALSSYQLMMSNSSFTKKYSDIYWDYPNEKNHVLHPPIGSKFIEMAKKIKMTGVQKKKNIVNIGRFNPGNHNKNQLLIIEAFLAARKKTEILRGWTLTLIGNENDTPESKEYLLKCKNLEKSSEGAVTILNGVTSDELSKVLFEAFGYVHGTGAFLEPGLEPHKCEHFGLGIIEAMAHGCLPLVYARGGIFDVIESGVNGIPYISYDGLIEGFSELATRYNSPDATRVQKKCAESAALISQDQFTEKLLQHIKQVL